MHTNAFNQSKMQSDRKQQQDDELVKQLNMYTYEMQDKILNSFKRTVSYASDAIAHYEHFMDHMMPFIITEYSRVEVPSSDGKEKQIIKLRNVVVQKPTVDDSDVSVRGLKAGKATPLFPMEARNRGLTYNAQVLVDIVHSSFVLRDGGVWESKGAPTVYREMQLFEMPVMLGSKYCYTADDASAECWMDLGGYFIIRGNAKVLQPQKVQRNNMHLVKGGKHKPVDMDIRSRRDDEKFRSTSTLYMHLSGSPPMLTLDIPFLKSGLNIVTAFRLMGIHKEEEISALLWGGGAKDPEGAARRLFSSNFTHPLMTCSMEEVLDTAGSCLTLPDASPEKVRRQVQQQVCGELLPHMGFDDAPLTRIKKSAYLAIIVRRMLEVYLGRADADDRDFEGHKSVQMSAGVLSIMFRQQFAATMKFLRNSIYDRYKNGKHLDISALMSDTLSRFVLYILHTHVIPHIILHIHFNTYHKNYPINP